MRNWLVAAAIIPVAAMADPASEVRCAEIRFSLAAEARDPEAFRLQLDPDARFAGSEVFRGPEAIATAWAPFFSAEGPRITWRPQVVEVLESGDLALTRGPYRLETVGKDGEAVVRWGTFNSVWRKGADHRWRVVFDAGGPPIESPSEDAKQLLEAPVSECIAGPKASE
jgi:ketosteroid isomerase-like protein